MKICKKCGASSQDISQFCKFCGEAFLEDNTQQESDLTQQQQQNDFTQQQQQSGNVFQNPQNQNIFTNTYQYYSEKKGAEDSTVSMICGILAIIMSGLNYFGVIIVHLVGIVLGIIAISKSRLGIKSGNGKAVAGLICGIIGLILGVIALIIGIIAGIMLAEQQY